MAGAAGAFAKYASASSPRIVVSFPAEGVTLFLMIVFLNGVALLAAAAGHAEWWVTVINRVHAYRISSRVLTWIRRLHDVAIPIFPPILLWRVGLTSDGVLRGGRWSDLPTGWLVVLAICWAGFAGLCAATVRWQWRSGRTSAAPQTQETVNVAGALGGRPIGRGPYRSLARLPLNEAFQVEISEKELSLPRLPSGLIGLRILHLSDVHFLGAVDRPYYDFVFERLSRIPVDLIAFTGDLFDDFALKDWLGTTFARLNAPLGRYFILGNHDWYLDSDEIRRSMTELGWTDMCAAPQELTFNDSPLLLAGSEMPWMGSLPNWPATPADAFRILLSHTPDDLAFARRNRVDLMLAGHNHGGQIVLPIIGPVYSPSRYGVRYAAGTFFEPPTLLHVSRGLSGRHPLRWRCRPEVTVLTLRQGEHGR